MLNEKIIETYCNQFLVISLVFMFRNPISIKFVVVTCCLVDMLLSNLFAQSAGAVEYTDCFSAER